jgi:hypothetical protein
MFDWSLNGARYYPGRRPRKLAFLPIRIWAKNRHLLGMAALQAAGRQIRGKD